MCKRKCKNRVRESPLDGGTVVLIDVNEVYMDVGEPNKMADKIDNRM